jgi:hypothetical protein
MKVGDRINRMVVYAEKLAAEEVARVRASDAEWVLVRRKGGLQDLLFRRQEFLERVSERTSGPHGLDIATVPLRDVLKSSTGATRAPEVGSSTDAEGRVTQSARRQALAEPIQAALEGYTGAEAVTCCADEGATPMRYPSVEAEGLVLPGADVTIVVDLLLEESAQTFGAVTLPQQDRDWSEVTVEVLLQSSAIDFDNEGRGALTVRRNALTLPARVMGRVRAGLTGDGELEIRARFLIGTRFCGSAARRLVFHDLPADDGAVGAAAAVQIDQAAEQPDITIFISPLDSHSPGRLHWRMVTTPFSGCPPKLDGLADLGLSPGEEAARLLSHFAVLERGKHTETIEGFGEELWRRAPPEFHSVYWALCDHHRRSLTIQFVSDDPYMPWELMSPCREGEMHGPIALRHAVARWIGGWAGYMRNRLPDGTLVAIAPQYKSASTRLSLSDAIAQGMVDKFGARRLAGTREKVLELLEAPPSDTVALLYFNGHGAFAADAAGSSIIKLEDGSSLSAREVARHKIMLGERDGTVVFLNACEVGATASVLGGMGGWAEAFLSRKFGAFVAPLWAIDEEDARLATEELFDALVSRRQPLGSALRDLRRRHGPESPTFYSYLLYGDVTARLGSFPPDGDTLTQPGWRSSP